MKVNYNNYTNDQHCDLLPGRVTDQWLKCANILCVVHLLHIANYIRLYSKGVVSGRETIAN